MHTPELIPLSPWPEPYRRQWWLLALLTAVPRRIAEMFRRHIEPW